MARIGDGKVRHHFRTREGSGDARLPVGACATCGQETYQVPNGVWLHWSTLTLSCPTLSTADPTLPLGVGSASGLLLGVHGGLDGREGVMS